MGNNLHIDRSERWLHQINKKPTTKKQNQSQPPAKLKQKQATNQSQYIVQQLCLFHNLKKKKTNPKPKQTTKTSTKAKITILPRRRFCFEDFWQPNNPTNLSQTPRNLRRYFNIPLQGRAFSSKLSSETALENTYSQIPFTFFDFTSLQSNFFFPLRQDSLDTHLELNPCCLHI